MPPELEKIRDEKFTEADGDLLWLKLDGSNANQTINLGAEDLITSGDITTPKLKLDLGSGNTMPIVGLGSDTNSQLNINTADGEHTLTVTGNATVNQDTQTTGSPTFLNATISNDLIVEDTLKVEGNVGIGVTASANSFEPLIIEGARVNNFLGMYLKNTSADGISRFNLGMTLAETTLGILMQYDAGDGRALILNRKASTGVLDFLTTGGTGVSIRNDGSTRLGGVSTNYISITQGGDISFVGDAEVASNLPFENAKFIVFDKASGNGIKIDTTTPTFGWRDLLGDQFAKNTGATKPTLATYNGDVDAWQFQPDDEAFLTYHIPHDYVKGTDIHLHVHWSLNAVATGGTLDFKYFAIYAKGHNQASGSAFTTTPITATFSTIDINDGGQGLTKYQHHLTEVIISGASATVALFDRDDFEPDGVIELTLELDADNLTGTPSDPFIHYVDIHYQSTNISTKEKAPDFYA